MGLISRVSSRTYSIFLFHTQKMPKFSLKELESKLDSNGLLDLSMSKITEISFLKKLKNSKFSHKIKSLDLSDNRITFNNAENNDHSNTMTIENEKLIELTPFPISVKSQPSSEKEQIGNNLQNIQNHLPNLSFINLSNNQIENLPAYFGFIKSLQKIDLYGNNLKTLNVDVFGNLSKLIWLDISSNENLDDESKKLISPGNDKNDTARNVKQFYTEKFNKIHKFRLKKIKKQNKVNEKQAKELKLKQKEERRKAYHEKIEQEKLNKKLEAENESSSDESNTENLTDKEDSSQNSDSDSIKEMKQLKKHVGPNIFIRFFGSLFSAIFAVFSFIIGLIFTIIMLPFKICYVIISYIILIIANLISWTWTLFKLAIVTGIILYFACAYIPDLQYKSDTCSVYLDLLPYYMEKIQYQVPQYFERFLMENGI